MLSIIPSKLGALFLPILFIAFSVSFAFIVYPCSIILSYSPSSSLKCSFIHFPCILSISLPSLICSTSIHSLSPFSASCHYYVSAIGPLFRFSIPFLFLYLPNIYKQLWKFLGSSAILGSFILSVKYSSAISFFALMVFSLFHTSILSSSYLMILSAFPGFSGYFLIPFLLLLSNAFIVSYKLFPFIVSYTNSSDIFFSHFLSVSISLSWSLIFVMSSFSIYILIGLWSEMISSYFSSSILIHSFLISLVITISILVFYCFAPAPFLVHCSISYIVQFCLCVSFFHFLYLALLTSVLMSM